MAGRPHWWAMAAALLAFAVPQTAGAQTFPSKTITVVVGFAPGGFADVIARLVGQKLGERLGQAVVIENKAGAGGNLAHRQVASSTPDGHTILAATTSLAINESLYKNRGYSADEFTTLSVAASMPEFLGANPDRAEKSLADFVAAAKTKPINFATAGAGSASYIVTEYFFKVLAKVPAVHIPYQGGAPALNAAIANHVDLVAGGLGGGFVPQVQSGKLRGIALASEKRLDIIKDTPTYIESGYAGFTASAWAGFFVPSKTSPEIVTKLNTTINAIMQDPEVVAKLQGLGFAPIVNTQSDAEKLFRAEIEKWSKMVNAVGATVN